MGNLTRTQAQGNTPGPPRTPIPDSATGNSTADAISVNRRNSHPTTQHDTQQVESDTGTERSSRGVSGGRRRPDF